MSETGKGTLRQRLKDLVSFIDSAVAVVKHEGRHKAIVRKREREVLSEFDHSRGNGPILRFVKDTVSVPQVLVDLVKIVENSDEYSRVLSTTEAIAKCKISPTASILPGLIHRLVVHACHRVGGLSGSATKRLCEQYIKDIRSEPTTYALEAHVRGLKVSDEPTCFSADRVRIRLRPPHRRDLVREINISFPILGISGGGPEWWTVPPSAILRVTVRDSTLENAQHLVEGGGRYSAAVWCRRYLSPSIQNRIPQSQSHGWRYHMDGECHTRTTCPRLEFEVRAATQSFLEETEPPSVPAHHLW